jgi:hypothetical protein
LGSGLSEFTPTETRKRSRHLKSVRAIATARRSGVPIEGPECSDRDLLLRPMHERYRALLAAGRGQAGEAKQWAAKAISSADGTVHLAGGRGQDARSGRW